jgi:prepilin-type N-terminal cleavage/methylation domain-containing protein
LKKAFTLIEIMVVVAIVVILITIAVPNILRSRVVANEGAAIANLKTLASACQSYHIDNQKYPANLLDFSTATPPYIDNVLGSGLKQGYQFNYNSADPDHFTVNANSANTGLLKGRYFYIDESAAIRVRNDAPAGPTDEIIG